MCVDYCCFACVLLLRVQEETLLRVQEETLPDRLQNISSISCETDQTSQSTETHLTEGPHSRLLFKCEP